MILWKKKTTAIFGKKEKHLFFFLVISLFFSTNLLAQRPGQATNSRSQQGPGGQNGSSLQSFRKISKDSLLIFYYYMKNPNEEFPYRDTLLNNYFHQFDPARSRVLDHGTLGYLGSPTFPLFYQSSLRQGFDVGLHQYDLYKIKVDDLRFYNLKRAYSDFYFSQGGSQDDIQLKGKFSRNFNKNVNISIDYHRISQYGSSAPVRYFYQNQRARHTALAGGLTFKNDANTYQGFFAFSNNIHQQEDNGGIESDTAFLQEDNGFASTLSIPVWLDDAETRHSEQEISYTHYYNYNPIQFKANKKRKAEEKAKAKAAAEAVAARAARIDSLSKIPIDSTSISNSDSLKIINPVLDSLKNAPTDTLQNLPLDSLQKTKVDSVTNQRPTPPSFGPPPSFVDSPPQNSLPKGRTYTLMHRLAYKKGTYRFSDISAFADSSYYKNLLLDLRGLRHFVQTRKIENTFAISTFKPRKPSADKVKQQSDFFEIGIRHSFNWIDEEATDSTVNNLFLTGKWNFAPSERLKVKTYAHLGLWDNAGDYRVSGEFFFDLKKLGQLQLSGVNQFYRPELLQQRFYISSRNAWSNDFKPTLETNLSATYALPKWGFQVSGKYHLLNNFIYFDTVATAQQTGAPLSIFQLILQQNFQFGNFNWDNVIVLQQTTNDALNLPNLFSKHSFYYDGKWFKRKLQIKLGVDVRMNDSYFANTYNPLVGQFILQNTQKINFFPAVDASASIKVQQFRFFVKAENLTRFFADAIGSIQADEQYYQAALYPIQNSRFRLGLGWKFGN
ncbi:MAG: putative porin [Saprospiraceae bacterium]